MHHGVFGNGGLSGVMSSLLCDRKYTPSRVVCLRLEDNLVAYISFSYSLFRLFIIFCCLVFLGQPWSGINLIGQMVNNGDLLMMMLMMMMLMMHLTHY